MEAVVIVIVPLIAAAIYLGARFAAAGQPVNPQEELRQLHERLAWQEDRLRRAREQNWDEGMTGQIAAQLADTQLELARVSLAAGRSRI